MGAVVRVEEQTQRLARAGAGQRGVGRQEQVGMCADGQLVDVEGEGAFHWVAEGPGHRAESVHWAARPPSTEVRSADGQLAYRCEQVWVIGMSTGLHP